MEQRDADRRDPTRVRRPRRGHARRLDRTRCARARKRYLPAGVRQLRELAEVGGHEQRRRRRRLLDGRRRAARVGRHRDDQLHAAERDPGGADHPARARRPRRRRRRPGADERLGHRLRHVLASAGRRARPDRPAEDRRRRDRTHDRRRETDLRDPLAAERPQPDRRGRLRLHGLELGNPDGADSERHPGRGHAHDAHHDRRLRVHVLHRGGAARDRHRKRRRRDRRPARR